MQGYLKKTAQRFTFFTAVLAGLVVFIFILFVTLASPEEILAGQRSDKATVAAIKEELGLNDSKGKQLLYYFNDLSPVSFYNAQSAKLAKVGGWKFYKTNKLIGVIKAPYLRTSFVTRKPVITLIGECFAGTLILSFAALLFSILLGIPLGILAALKKNTWIDRAIVGFSVLGISMPSFFSAMLFSWLFGFVWKSWTGLSMTGSLWEIDALGEQTHIAWRNLVLPSLALGIRPLSVFVQLSRNNLADMMQMDFVRTARAKGLKESQVILKHALPNALNPLVTSAGGWLGSLLAGAFFTEFIFNWKGIGKLTIDALQQSDLPVIMGTILFTAALFFVINLATEFLYTRIDPRLRNG